MKNLILGVLLFLPFVAKASELDQTTLTQTMMDNGYGLKLFIKAEGDAVRDSSHCHSSAWDYVLSTEDEFGKQMLSQVLMAFASKKKVKLIGNDVCIVNGNIEGLKRIEIY